MEISDLIVKFGKNRETQVKAIFSTLFIAANRLQTLFDNSSPQVSLKQFMLLTMVRQSKEQLTFTELGKLLGCSRQNIKKLAYSLEKKGFVFIEQNENDARALCIRPAQKLHDFFDEMALEHQQKLRHIFGLYSDEEIELLFSLLSRLHESIDHAERTLAPDQSYLSSNGKSVPLIKKD